MSNIYEFQDTVVLKYSLDTHSNLGQSWLDSVGFDTTKLCLCNYMVHWPYKLLLYGLLIISLCDGILDSMTVITLYGWLNQINPILSIRQKQMQ